MTPIRFGAFEVDAQSGELRRDGKKVKIQEQPFQVLILLLERPGEVLTREELVKRLWSDQTNVDFERGLNKAITRLREALGDTAENPRYVETLPRRGYRFIGHVTNGAHVAEVETKSIEVPVPESRTRSPRMAILASLVVILLIVGIVASWRWTVKTTRMPKVLGFRQLMHPRTVPSYYWRTVKQTVTLYGFSRCRLGLPVGWEQFWPTMPPSDPMGVT
jgi:DNA-binding winged helix-turn-helix (wHTH) protein